MCYLLPFEVGKPNFGVGSLNGDTVKGTWTLKGSTLVLMNNGNPHKSYDIINKINGRVEIIELDTTVLSAGGSKIIDRYVFRKDN